MYFGLKGRLSSVTLIPHPVSICQLLVLAGETAEYVSIPPLLHCTSGPNNFPQPWACFTFRAWRHAPSLFRSLGLGAGW